MSFHLRAHFVVRPSRQCIGGREGQRDANRNPSERVGRRRGPGPGIDAPQDLDTFAPSPRDHPGHARSGATPASHVNEGARWFHQSRICLRGATNACCRRRPGGPWRRPRRVASRPVLRYRAMVCGVAAPGLAARPYFSRYTEDAIDLCDVLSSFSSQNKPSLHELCRVMGFPGKPDGIGGADVEKCCREGASPKSRPIARRTSSTHTGSGCATSCFVDD